MEYAFAQATDRLSGFGQDLRADLRSAGEHLVDHIIPHPRNNYQPHLLGHRTLALFSLFLVAAKVSAIGAAILLAPVDTAYSSAITTETVLTLTNADRTDNSEAGLTLNSSLAEAAQAKADDMLAKQYFAHTSPEGRTPWYWFKQVGYNYLIAGENLAVDFTQAENVNQAWMNSPGHRANILNKDFKEIGIGIAQGQFEGHTSIFVVQMFGTLADQVVLPANEPTKVAPAPTPVSNPEPKPTAFHLRVRSAQAASPVPPAPIISPPAPIPPSTDQAAEIAITANDLQIIDNSLHLNVTTSGPVSKLIAQYGQLAIMLDPKGGNTWHGSIKLSDLSTGNHNITLQAFDSTGKVASEQVASFSDSLEANYHPSAEASPGHSVLRIGNWQFDPTAWEHNFYLLFIAGLLGALVLAIGIKRHVQHLGLIANSAFVIGLACLMFVSG